MKSLVHVISSLKRGGAESLLVDLLAELKGYEHQVIYFHDGPNRQRLEKMGIKTYHIKGFISLYDPIFFTRLFLLIGKLKPDCIHSALWAANFASRLIAKLLNIPLISVVHLGVHQDGKIRNLIDAVTFNCSKKVIAVSDEVADSLHKKKWIPACSISVIINGISSQRIKAEANDDLLGRADLFIPNSAFVVGSVGRFIARKNFPLLLQSFAQLRKQKKDSYLILVGFGPLEMELRRLSEKLGIDNQVCFVVGRAAYGVYPLFDCFVLPSFQEGMSIALLEAMCFSLPCIVTTNDGYHEVIESEHNGLIIPSNNQDFLTKQLVRLASDSQLCQKLGKNALHSIDTTFNIRTMAEQYKNIFTREMTKASQ